MNRKRISTRRITGGSRPPWHEHVVDVPEIVIDSTGRAVVRSDVRPGNVLPPHPDRPNVWHEIISADGRVMLRSQRPLAQLIPVLVRGEAIYRARRKDPARSVNTVTRRLVFGATEGA